MKMKLNDKLPEESVSTGEKRFTLRMDSRLFEQISVIAKEHRRSIAKEIECAIEEYVQAIAENET